MRKLLILPSTNEIIREYISLLIAGCELLPYYFYVTFQNNATFVITIRAVQLMILYKICLLSRSADNPSIEFHELRYETRILSSSNFDFRMNVHMVSLLKLHPNTNTKAFAKQNCQRLPII